MPKKPSPRRFWLSSSPWLALLLLAVAGSYYFFNREPQSFTLDYGKLKLILQDRNAAVRFKNVRVGRTEVRGDIVTTDEVSDGKLTPVRVEQTKSFRTPRVGVEGDQGLFKRLDETVREGYQGEEEESAIRAVYSLFMSFIVIFMVVLVGFFLFRWMAGGNSPLTFGRSRHKLYAEKDLHITFKDVAGIDEAVQELREIVDFLKNPAKYQVLGGRIPKGVLLVGPPGTGKTLLAKAVAGEADVPFFGMSGSDFVEMFVGVGASRVRDLFGQAESRAPCIIFIDELDALGKSRGAGMMGGHDEREQTLNQLLVEMDGFDSNRGVIIMAATNRPETLDAALLRPGRFDRTVVVDRPDIVGREAILRVHTRNVKLADDVDLRHVAALTPGTVGADLANLVNEAALMAARNSKFAVNMAEFNEAVERGAVGLERKSRIMHVDEKQRIAYHEAGHAIVACALPNTFPVHKVSIIPRGIGALGYVLQRPDEDRYIQTRSDLESHIKVALAGTLAEELVYHEIASGASNDLEKVNAIARNMVTRYGMSRLGRVCYPDQSMPTFLPGASWSEGERKHSEETAREIDIEVRKIVNDAMEEVRGILQSRRAALEAVARTLMEREVIDGAELKTLIDANEPGLKLVPGSVAVTPWEPSVEAGSGGKSEGAAER
ncbi:MAG TPA: ATP-dependent zinc metalloprotease FtsH [Gemmataceae bacterium]|nr:ATP-dependent zinc metalloprotease FtsH [Gemmataceae bacterium]